MRHSLLGSAVAAAIVLCPLAAASAAVPPRSDVPAPVTLAGQWAFHPDGALTGEAAGWQLGTRGAGWTGVGVPSVFDPRPLPSLFGGTVGWYRITFRGPATPAGFGWAIRFEQVRRSARVWLNGTEIGAHQDPYTPFVLPLRGLRPAAPNTLVVRVDSRKGAEPREGWWNWGGITRPVSLVPLGPAVLEDVGFLPRLRCAPGGSCNTAKVLVDGWVRNRSPRALRPRVTVALAPPHGQASQAAVTLRTLRPGQRVRVSFAVPIRGAPQLWSPGHPVLYDAQVSLLAAGRPAQQTRTSIGLRSVAVRGGHLYLNGRQIVLHGASVQEDVPGRGPALTGHDMDQIVSGLQAVHANVTRAHYLLHPGLLDRLDRAGILVWSQAPIYHRDELLHTPAQRAAALQTLRGTLLAVRNHPSVFTTSVANELAPTPDAVPGTRRYLEQAARLARDLDPTLPVSLDLLSYPGYPRQRTYTRFDLLGINNYFGWYPGKPGHSTASLDALGPYLRSMHRQYPRQAMVMSEFGAEATRAGPATQKQTYAFQSQYIRRTLDIIDHLPFMGGAIYWTLREFAVKPHWDGGANRADSPHDSIHHKGLITYLGHDKPAFSTVARRFAASPLYPGPGTPSGRANRLGPLLDSALLVMGAITGLLALLVVNLWVYVAIRFPGARWPLGFGRVPWRRRTPPAADTTYA